MRCTAASTMAIIDDVNLNTSRSIVAASNITVLFGRMDIVVSKVAMAMSLRGRQTMTICNKRGHWMAHRYLAE